MGMNDRSLDLRWTLFAVVIFCITLTVGAGTALGDDGFTPQHWQVSRSYPADRVDLRQYPHFFSIFQAGWEDVEAEPDGRLPLTDLRPRQFDGGDCVLVRTTCVCDAPVTATVVLASDDDLVVFVNGQRQTIDPQREDGSIVMTLKLRRGLNELMLAVTTTDDAMSLTCRSDHAFRPPCKAHHRMTKLWETEAVFNIPESALYDAERDVIYISSFARVQTRETHRGFISRLSTDGEILDLQWVTGLDGPCGMALRDDRLFVVECSGHLVEINADTAEIEARYPVEGATFLNDLTVTPDGVLYFTDTTRAADGVDIYRFAGGVVRRWKTGTDLHRTNGLFAHGGVIAAGSTGDGYLKTVDLGTGAVEIVASLAPRVIDGIRRTESGAWLVSHWEGQVYAVTDEGEVTELLDLQPAGLNTADFEYIRDRRQLIIPTFLGNRVVAYELEAEAAE
jgi:hypothetical protein